MLLYFLEFFWDVCFCLCFFVVLLCFAVAFILFSFVFIFGQNFSSSSKDTRRYNSCCRTEYKNNNCVAVMDIGDCTLLMGTISPINFLWSSFQFNNKMIRSILKWGYPNFFRSTTLYNQLNQISVWQIQFKLTMKTPAWPLISLLYNVLYILPK